MGAGVSGTVVGDVEEAADVSAKCGNSSPSSHAVRTRRVNSAQSSCTADRDNPKADAKAAESNPAEVGAGERASPLADRAAAGA